MSDIIHLLPDSVANQIAAGEVVQRPASAVKELLENAIDAGAKQIKLIIKDAGRTLIQVIDDGCGMSDTDARLCFERHATSKIRSAQDLFVIRTMGFRGEALASIAAVAQVELKTKMRDNELGTSIVIEGSEIKEQSVCRCNNGTSIAVKNLFFNIPARRSFLKSNSIELKHIEEEFFRVALIHTDVAFSFYSNDKLIYQLESSNLHQRITGLFGNNYKQRLHPVEEQTEQVKIRGYVCKPEFSKKTRGEQYMFVNNRFIKNFYFNNAIEKAYADLLPEKTYPSFFINMEVDSSRIDVNIHPTKTEVKFLDEVIIYAVLRAAVKRTLGQYSLATEFEFDTVEGMDLNPAPAPKGYIPPAPTITVNTNFNPFENTSYKKATAYSEPPYDKGNKWENFFEISNEKAEVSTYTVESNMEQETLFETETTESDTTTHNTSTTIQVLNRYIVSTISSGLLVVDQQRAHERILYERFISHSGKECISQQIMFPIQCSFSAADAEIISEIMPELKDMGFEMNPLGNTVFVITAIPAEINDGEVQNMLDEMVEDYKNSLMQKFNDKEQSIALSMAKQLAVKKGTKLKQEEMQNIIAQLFSCKIPNTSPFGKKTMIIMKDNDLTEKFK
ncbi:MAG: DNA mismatch repair endonuclease MutL [Bacteroidales bacterium]|nr:DNA mismatch repair endonuclease MutL [Bacteroidales bacterium]